jgi:hypothetical protein
LDYYHGGSTPDPEEVLGSGPYARIVQVLRIVHIQRSLESSLSDPTYYIVDAGRYGEESGFAETIPSLSSQDVGDWLARENVPYSTIARVLRELAEAGSAQVQIAPRVGPRIVRAWFDTVFNPLIPALDLELALLSKRNWTYSFAPLTLELVRPIRRRVREEAEANLDQVLQLNAALAANAQTHDVAVERLLSSVAALHGALVANHDFVDLCNSLMAPERLLELGINERREIFGAYPESDRFKLIAQNVVNGTSELPSHYSTAKFWNFNRERLLQSMTLPNVREHYAATVQVGDHLASVSRTLLNQLKELRLELSLRHDVPYVVTDRSRLTA